jgi:hypothetical protein
VVLQQSGAHCGKKMGVKKKITITVVYAIRSPERSIRSQNQRSLFPCLRFVSVNRTSCINIVLWSSSNRHVVNASPSTSQLGSRRSLGDRSVSRVPGVCLNYGNRPRVPAPGFDSYFWNCARRRRHTVATPSPSPRPALLETKLHLSSSVASHRPSIPE